jgi:hypothetical protein
VKICYFKFFSRAKKIDTRDCYFHSSSFTPHTVVGA